MAADRFEQVPPKLKPIRDAIDSFLNRLPLWFVIVATIALLYGMLWGLNQITAR
jgi:hypothetical protein